MKTAMLASEIPLRAWRGGVPHSPLAIPEGRRGRFSIHHRHLHPGENVAVVNMRTAVLTGAPPHYVRLRSPLLVHELHMHATDGSAARGTLMSDHPQELLPMQQFAEAAHGRVLIGGLGLGLVARLCAESDATTDVEVVELEQDIINLVSPTVPGHVKITNANLFTFIEQLPEWRFDSAFFDIWYPTSEMAWIDTVAPLRRIVRRRFGQQALFNWAEDEMVGQLRVSLSHQSLMPLERLAELPAAYRAFRKACTLPCAPELPADDEGRFHSFLALTLERQTDESFLHLFRFFINDVGSPEWESVFGEAWPYVVPACHE